MTQRLWRDDEESKQMCLNWNRDKRYLDHLKEEVIPFAEHFYATGSESDQQRALGWSVLFAYEMKEIEEGRLNAPEDWEG